MKAYEYLIKIRDRATSQFDKIRRSVGLADKGVDRFNKNLTKTDYGAKMLRSTVAGLAMLLVSAFSIGSISQFNSDIIKTRSEMEKYRAVLDNTFQSARMGGASMQMIKDFASSTPYQVNELTDSFVKLANRGVLPTKREMRNLGDLASSQGKSFDQLTEALLDAQTGEFERLKEFGVKASKAGDKVSLTFKGQTKVVKMNDQAIKDYIMSLGQMKGVSGSMEVISKTLGGRLSNLTDKYDNLKNKIGKGLTPVYSIVIDKTGQFIDMIGNNLPSVAMLAGGFGTLGVAMMGYSAASMYAKLAADSLTKSIIRQNIKMMFNPYTLIAVAVIGLAAWLVKLYNTNERVRVALDGFLGAVRGFIGGFSEWMQGMWSGIKTYAQGIWQVAMSLTVGIRKRMMKFAQWVTGMWKWVAQKAVGAWKWMYKTGTGVWNAVINRVRQARDFIKRVLSPLIRFLGKLFEPMRKAFNRVLDGIRNKMISFLNRIKGKLTEWLGIDVDAMIAGLRKARSGAEKMRQSTTKLGEQTMEGYRKGAAKGLKAFSQGKGGLGYEDMLPDYIKKARGQASDNGTAPNTSGGGASGGGGHLAGIVGGSDRPTNITVHIEKLDTDIQLSVPNIEAGADEIKRIVEDAILRAVNSVNQMQR